MKTMLFNWLGSSSACLLGAWALTVMWRNKSAAWRHLGWGLGFVAALVCGALTVTSWRVEVPLLAAVENSSAAEVQVETVSVSGDVAPVSLPSTTVARSVDWWLVVWLSGAAVCLSPLMVGWWRVRKFLQRDHGVHGGEQQQNLLHALRDLPVKKSTLLFSDAALVPLTVGIFAPKIVLPSSASAWPAERLRRVLAHELAHQQRHDLMWALLAQVVCALCWFNPLAWFAAHCQRLESERACDDCVINSGAAATDYADDLLQILKDCPRDVLSPLVMTMARHSQIKPRLQSLLAADVQRGAVRRGVALALTVSVLLVVAALMVVRVSHVMETRVPAVSFIHAEGKTADINMRIFAVPKDAAVLKSKEFKRAWNDADGDKILKLLPQGALINSPAWTTKLGVATHFKTTRELRYPTEWAAPKVEKVEFGVPKVEEDIKISAHPAKFAVKEVGSDMQAKVEVQDGKIDLEAKIKITELVGGLTETGDENAPLSPPVFAEREKWFVGRLENGGGMAGWLPESRNAAYSKRYGVWLTVRLVNDEEAKSAVKEKLRTTVIPKCEFTDADIQEVLNYLQDQSKALDAEHTGVNFVLKSEPTAADEKHPWRGERTLTVSLRELPLGKVLDFITQVTSYRYRVEEHAVFVYPNTEINEPLLVKTFSVPENFLPATVSGVEVKEVLEGRGVEFLSNTSAAYLPKTKKLVVRNTLEQLEKIEALLKNSEPPKPDAPKLDVKKKLESIIIPEGKLADADLGDVAKFLRVKSREFDPEKVGVIFLIQKPAAAETAPMRKVTVNFKNYSLKQIVEQIPVWFSWQYKVEDYAVFFVPGTELEVGAGR